MPTKLSQRGPFGAMCRALGAGSVKNGVLGFRVLTKNAIIRSEPGSSGEYRFIWGMPIERPNENSTLLTAAEDHYTDSR